MIGTFFDLNFFWHSQGRLILRNHLSSIVTKFSLSIAINFRVKSNPVLKQARTKIIYITIKETEKVIHWYAFKNLPTCSHCGAQPEETTECKYCATKKNQKRTTLQIIKHCVLQEHAFPVFWNEYRAVLGKHTLH